MREFLHSNITRKHFRTASGIYCAVMITRFRFCYLADRAFDSAQQNVQLTSNRRVVGPHFRNASLQ